MIPGMSQDDRLKQCVDVDECATMNGKHKICEKSCTNLAGSYKCDCPKGFRLIGKFF